jgi:hypothetical protein
MKPKSHTLFHFTKNIDFVKSILSEGFWPRYCLEDLSWYAHNIDFVAFPMVCFCDIPLSRINEHVSFYGEYGIGVKKEWALANKLNPVSYLSASSNYGTAINNLYKNFDHSGSTTYYKNAGRDLNIILSNLKPLDGNMVVSGKHIHKEFYQENEWRYNPGDRVTNPWLAKLNYEKPDLLESYNQETKSKCSLIISPGDIKYIFVKKDSDIPDIINFIQTELDHYSSSDLKILMSRVVSLESISSDL